MWRPGCPFCGSLRRGLSRAGVATIEHNIWSSADAAARVRQATGGDKTVPTVFVGDRALVNPSVRQVIDAIRAADPDDGPHSRPATSRGGGADTGKFLGAGLIWAIVVAVVWSVLVAWRPTTTWHLAPLILAAAWPWVVGGLAAALALVETFYATGRLDGPTWTGSGTPVVEALLLSGTGAAIATTVGLLRTVRRATSASARPGTSLIAKSDDIVTVEGNAYFPLTSVPTGVLRPSSTTSVCPWKGVASYYDVRADGQVVPDGTFTYHHPSPLARRFKGRVAFCQGIEIDTTRQEQTDPNP
ncbi:hypothetical protein BH10ACT10_BH10ACT10_00700 [soil metagenome]